MNKVLGKLKEAGNWCQNEGPSWHSVDGNSKSPSPPGVGSSSSSFNGGNLKRRQLVENKVCQVLDPVLLKNCRREFRAERPFTMAITFAFPLQEGQH